MKRITDLDMETSCQTSSSDIDPLGRTMNSFFRISTQGKVRIHLIQTFPESHLRRECRGGGDDLSTKLPVT